MPLTLPLRARNTTWRVVFILLVLLASSLFGTILHHAGAPERQPSRANSSEGARPFHRTALDSSTLARLAKAYGELPLSFEANQGQADPLVDFVARSAGYNLLLNADGATMVLPKRNQEGGLSGRQSRQTNGGSRTPVSQVRMFFVNANHQARACGVDQLSGQSNHIIGRARKDWHVGVPSFAQVEYRNIYPGADL